MKKLEEALEKASTALTSKSLNGNAIDAMHFSQAALNCVQALGVAADIRMRDPHGKVRADCAGASTECPSPVED